MDQPTQRLEEMRILAYQARTGNDPRRHERELRWRFEELDRWLTNGGELPRDWQRTL